MWINAKITNVFKLCRFYLVAFSYYVFMKHSLNSFAGQINKLKG